MTQLRLIIYFVSTYLISSSVGLNSVIIPLFMEENPQVFGPLFSTIILSTESVIAIIICLLMAIIIRKIGIKISLMITIVFRALALAGMAFITSGTSWLILSALVGAGSFFCLMTIQFCINHIEIKKFKGLVYALFGTIISLGIATGPIIYANKTILSRFLPASTCELWEYGHEGPFIISAALTLLFSLPLFWNRNILPNLPNTDSFSIPDLISANKGVLFAVALCGISFFGVSWHITVYGIRNELGLQEASLLLTAFMLGSVSLDTPISTLSEYFDRRFVLVYSALICTILAIFLPLAIYENYQAYILLFIWGGLISGMYSISLTLLESKYGPEDALASSTVFALMENTGAMGGLILIGILVHFIGTDGFSYVIIFANMVYFSFVLMTYKVKFKSSS
ncbi:MFS transporter [Reichenbachiella sp.]|uniref:MFS transporter n=1 Tax=Reichenbachiella sp. TaxID=2184521 RepID=UPI003BB13666